MVLCAGNLSLAQLESSDDFGWALSCVCHLLVGRYPFCVCWLAGCRLSFWPDVPIIHQASLGWFTWWRCQGSQEQQKDILLCRCFLSLHLCPVCYCHLAKECPELVQNNNTKSH